MKRTGPKPLEFHAEYSRLPMNAEHAKYIGEATYFTGKRCGRGHLSPRYASSGNCMECIEHKRGISFLNKRGKSSIRTKEDQERAEAAFSIGEKVYVSIKPCPQGHTARRISTNNCIECEGLNNKKRKQKSKWSRYEKIYGLSQDGFNALLKKQNQLCCICEQNLLSKNLHVDHCHKTGIVRGLLCSKCNQAIGLLDEDVGRFEKAAKYIARFCHVA